MIGIDIVDLHDPLLKDRTENDLRFISSSEDILNWSPFSSVHYWMIWSAKEAVFKSYRRLSSFDPKAIPLKTADSSTIFSSGDNLGFWELNEQYVLAIVGRNTKVRYQVYQTETQGPSPEIRSRIISDFESFGRKVKIMADDIGIPHIIDLRSNYTSMLSLAHHGRFMAYGVEASFVSN